MEEATTALEPTRFFRVFFPEHHSHRMEIPSGFRKHAQDLPLGSVSLVTGSGGESWEVELGEAEGRLFFQDSWEEFVRDQALQPGEFLVFQYEGGSRFQVLVFDYSCCEKEGSSTDLCPLQEASEVSEEMDPGEVEALRPLVVEANGFRRRGRKPLDWGSGPERPSRAKRILISHRRPVRQEEIARTEAAALAFRSTNPYVVLILRKSSVYTGYMLSIPNVFAKAHLPKEGRSLRLVDPMGRVWPVTYVSTYGYFFSGGWRRFSIGNNLEEHDACVFELIEPKTIKVHIFRVVEEIIPKTLKYVDGKEPMTYQINGGLQ